MKKFFLYGFLCLLGFNTMILGGIFGSGFGGFLFMVGLGVFVVTFYLTIHHWLNWDEKTIE